MGFIDLMSLKNMFNFLVGFPVKPGEGTAHVHAGPGHGATLRYEGRASRSR